MVDLTYQAGIQPEGLPGRPYPRFPDAVSPQETGEETGRGIEAAGSVAEGVYKQQQAAQAAQAAQARQAQAMDGHNQLQALSLQLTHDPQNGAYTKQGKNAFGLTQQYLPQFDSGAQAIIDKVADPQARQAVMQSAKGMRNQLTEQLDNHELEQHRQFDIQTTQDSITLASQAAAANYNHPDILATNLDNINFSVDKLAQQRGWSDEQKNEYGQKVRSAVHGDVIDRMLTDDRPQMAEKYLESVKADMDAHSAWAAQKTIEAHIKEKQNEQKQDIADRFNDSMEAAEAGLKNPVTVTRAEMDILYPKDAQRRWDGLHSMVQAGAQARTYNQMTPEEIDADLESKRPTEGGPESAFQIRSYNILERAKDRSLAQRKADPAKFAIDNGFGWEPINFQNPQQALAQLRSRANSAQDVSQQVGIPVPLLTKTEGRQVTQALDSAKPSDAAAMLAQLHRALPDERSFGSVLNEIAPHSPVLAVAGALTNVPPKASAPSWYDARFAADPQAAEGIIDGERILAGKGEEKVKGGFVMPPDEDSNGKSGLATTFRKAAGGDYNNLFAGRDQTAELYYGAFKSYYAHLAAEKGVMTGVVDQDLATKAATAVLGDRVRFNHTDMSVPRGMDPSRFETTVEEGIRDAAKKADLDPVLAGALRESAGLRELDNTLGSGRYALIDGNGMSIKQKDGAPIIVDLSTVKAPPRLSQSDFDQAWIDAGSRQ